MYLKTLETIASVFVYTRIKWQACLKKTGEELELLIDTDMLLIVEKGIRGGICHAIHRNAKKIYIKSYYKNIISSCL